MFSEAIRELASPYPQALAPWDNPRVYADIIELASPYPQALAPWDNPRVYADIIYER